MLRLRIQVIANGQFFILTTNETLTIDLNSTIFNNGQDFLGSYSFPGTMPLEPNRALIHNLHYINTSGKGRTMDVLMWLNDLPYKQVKLYFTIETGKINYNLYIDSSIIAYQLKNTKLNALQDPAHDVQISMHSAAELKTYMMNAAQAAPGVYPMTFFPVKNDGAFSDAAYTGYPAYKSTSAYNVNDKFTYTNNRVYNTTTTTTAGMNPVSNADHFQDITVNVNIAFPVSKIINRWELDLDGNGSFIVNPDGGPYDQTIMPYFYLVYILKRIAQAFGYTTDGQWLNEEEPNRIVVMTNRPILSTLIANYTVFMPPILLSDFLKAIRSELGLLLDFDQTRKVMIVESLQNLVNRGKDVDLRFAQTSEGFRETGVQSQAYTIEQQPDSSDGAWQGATAGDLPQLVIGNLITAVQITDIQMTSVVTKMVTEQTPVNKAYVDPIVPIFSHWRIPYIKLPVYGDVPLDQVSTIQYADRYNFGLRLLSYRGMQKDDADYLYPYATNDNKDQAGNIISNFSLSIMDATGAFVPLKYYYNFLFRSKPFEMTFLLNTDDLLKLSPLSRVVVRDFNQSAVYCILSQCSADLDPQKQLIAAKLTLYPIIHEDNTRQVITADTSGSVPPPPVDNGTVYVRMDERNLTGGDFTHPPPDHNSFTIDIYAQFFEDAAGTIPKNVTNLLVRYKKTQTTYNNRTTTIEFFPTVLCTSTDYEYPLTLGTQDSYSQSNYSQSWTYELLTSADYHIIV